MDVTDIVGYNMEILNQHDLDSSFFCLSRDDPTLGFSYDASSAAGHTFPVASSHQAAAIGHSEDLTLRLVLGSHLARHLRLELEEHKRYTSTVGISSNKLLAKLVGNVHKPQGQTTLLPPYYSTADGSSNVTAFLDDHDIGQIPGIGFKLSQKIRDYVLNRPAGFEEGLIYGATKEKVTVHDVKYHPSLGAEALEKVLAGPGSPRGIGAKIWALLHGIDDTAVGLAKDAPSQISIEDSYLRLDTMDEILRELQMLSRNLIKRMQVDLTEAGDNDSAVEAEFKGISPIATVGTVSRRWFAQPKTLRLTTRTRPPLNPDGSRARTFNRISRSAPLPKFVLSLTEDVDLLAGRLTHEHLVPLFHKLHPEKGGWDLTLVNVAVTNMADTAGDSKTVAGRDIGRMFKRQNEVLKEWKVEDLDVAPDSPEEPARDAVGLVQDQGQPARTGSEDLLVPSQPSVLNDEKLDWEDTSDRFSRCPSCGTLIPTFAMPAHERYHELGE